MLSALETSNASARFCCNSDARALLLFERLQTKKKQCHVWALYREIWGSSYVPNSGVNKICLTVTTLTLLVMLKMFLGNEICYKLVFKHPLYAVWTVIPDEVAPSLLCRV